VDTGTTLIYVPTAAAEELYKQIPSASAAPEEIGTGYYLIPCSEMDTLSSVSFVFGSSSFAVNSLDFNLGPLEEGSTDCVAGIIGADDVTGSGNFAIVGDEFLKNWYSVFDIGSNSVGFAPATQSS